MGDRILNVNGVDIRGASHQDAVMALLVKADQMKITVQHDPLPSGFKVKQISKEQSLLTFLSMSTIYILQHMVVRWQYKEKYCESF